LQQETYLKMSRTLFSVFKEKILACFHLFMCFIPLVALYVSESLQQQQN
jgi:hypothetical protein